MSKADPARRGFLARLAAAGAAMLTGGCDKLSRTERFPKVLDSAETLTHGAQRLLTPRRSMAEEFTDADLSPVFRSNGTSEPDDEDYRTLARNGFAGYELRVDGLVGKPRSFTLAQLRALPARTQITRHDCVEGWSAIGKWTGVPLHEVLRLVDPHPTARFAVFHCADPMDPGGTEPYYESIDMDDARHAQTMLAYGLNGEDLPVANGAPIRLRVERQLGYKMAKYVMRIELVESFARIRGGKGGYWEDRGYEWYAGI